MAAIKAPARHRRKRLPAAFAGPGLIG